MTDQHHARSRLLLLRGKSTPHLRLNTERRQQVPGDRLSLHMNRTAHSRQGVGKVVVGDQVNKSMIAGAKVKIVRVREVVAVVLREAAVHRNYVDHLLWMVVGQRPKHYSVHYA